MEYNTKFIDMDDIIYNAYQEEFFAQWHGWKTFIDHKELGLEVVWPSHDLHKVYRIMDPKKWMLTKLKHGI